YFDFCAKTGEPYVFSSPDPIHSHYIGNSGLSVSVFSDISMLVREPVIEVGKAFCSAYYETGGTLEEFLNQKPEFRPIVETLMKFARAQDRIFGTTESSLWEKGDPESIRELFPSFFKSKE
ncbi:MAG: hypothetical protein KDD53_08220, partial [Bdellovibrionales bacterium]|nr:hypothetical protein [Bdellovibrionales bacterium]